MQHPGQILAVDNQHLEHIAGVAAEAGFSIETASDNESAQEAFMALASSGNPLDLAHLDLTRVRSMRGMQLLSWLRELPGDHVLPGGLRLRALPVTTHSDVIGPNSWKAVRRIDKGVPLIEDPTVAGALEKLWAKKLREHVKALGEQLEDAADPVDTWSLSGSRADIDAMLVRTAALAEELEARLQ
jgi:hypothetical protein